MAGRIRTTIRGALPAGEEFAFGVDTSADAVDDYGNLDDFASQVADMTHAELLTSDMLGLYAPDTVFTQVYCALYQGDGGGNSDVIATASLGNAHGISGSPLPNQVAVVVTTKTLKAGRSYRGRFYLPAPAVSVCNNHGQISDDLLQIIGNAARNWIVGFQGLDLGQNAGVWSSKLKTLTLIDRITVDSRFDTQRRRAASSSIGNSETYAVAGG